MGIYYQWKLYGALYCSRIDDLRCIFFSSSFDLRDCYGLIYILRLNFYSPDTDSVYNLALGITDVFIYFCDFLFVCFFSLLDFVDCDHVLKRRFLIVSQCKHYPLQEEAPVSILGFKI